MSIATTIKDVLAMPAKALHYNTQLGPIAAQALQRATAALAEVMRGHGAAALDATLTGDNAELIKWQERRIELAQNLANADAAYREALERDALTEQRRRADEHDRDIRSVVQKLALFEKAAVKLSASLENAGIAFNDAIRYGNDAFQTATNAGFAWPEWFEAGPPGTRNADMFRMAIVAELWRTAHGPIGINGTKWTYPFPGADVEAFQKLIFEQPRNDLKSASHGGPGNPAEALPLGEVIKIHVEQVKAELLGHKPPTPQPVTPAPKPVAVSDIKSLPVFDAPSVPADDHAPTAGAIRDYWTFALASLPEDQRPQFAAFMKAKYGAETGSAGEVPQARWVELQADLDTIINTKKVPELIDWTHAELLKQLRSKGNDNGNK